MWVRSLLSMKSREGLLRYVMYLYTFTTRSYRVHDVTDLVKTAALGPCARDIQTSIFE